MGDKIVTSLPTPWPRPISSLFSQAHTHPRFIYSVHQACVTNPSFLLPFFFLFRSRSCQTSSLLRPTRPPSRPSALSQRMSSEKQTRATQVSLVAIRKQVQCFMTPCPCRCSDGHGPCNPCPLHPVSKRHLVQLFTILHLHRLSWDQVFQCQSKELKVVQP